MDEKPVMTEKRLTKEEYHELYTQVDASCEPLCKRNVSFTYKNQYFQMGVLQP